MDLYKSVVDLQMILLSVKNDRLANYAAINYPALRLLSRFDIDQLPLFNLIYPFRPINF